MSTTEYPKTRKAANAVSRDKKTLAEALFEEIPPRGPGRKKAESDIEFVMTELSRVSELLAEDGHEIHVTTLADYRRTAGWVAKRSDITSFEWRPVSYSLHREAYTAGRSLRQFDAFLAKCEKTGEKATVNALRVSVGKPAMTRKADQPTAREVISQASPEEQARIVAELLKNPEIAEEAMTDRNVRIAVRDADQKQLDERLAESERKKREVLGDEVYEGLENTEALQELEMDLIRAHGWLKGYCQNLSEELLDYAPDSWKESNLRWLDRNESYIQIGRALVRGDDLDEGLNKLLAEERR